ncbi:MAG: hypothetical protein LBJ10_01455 [Clostridiales bacterium]|jgi:hypothetical protein|nr:hypothetical protein [Clostridiales bacterium]
MSRTEYEGFLRDMFEEIENPNGNFASAFGVCKSEEEKQALRRVAGAALMVVDRYYSNLSRMRAARSLDSIV